MQVCDGISSYPYGTSESVQNRVYKVYKMKINRQRMINFDDVTREKKKEKNRKLPIFQVTHTNY